MALKDRGILKFPSLVLATTGLVVGKLAGVYTFTINLLAFTLTGAVADLTAAQILIFTDNGDGTANYSRISLSDFLATSGNNVQVITAAGPANINANANTVIVNQTVGAAITLNLPVASSKIGKVKIVDWKGDSDANPITVAPNGSETFNGAAATWTISGQGASAIFDPYPGHGYAV